jgi:hypothetical protein
MSQSGLSIPNEAAASWRADYNLALQALGSQSSGSSAPGTTYAYQRWADTTNGLVKRRNAANSAWVIDGPLAETYLVARSSNTVLALGDHGKTFVFTSTFTQTLTAAATLGDGWMALVRNDGTGVITIDPNSAETIDGTATLTLFPGDSCAIQCNGSAFKTVGHRRSLTLRKTADQSFSSTSLANDSEIAFAIGANEEWCATGIFDIADTGVQGAIAAITVPSGASMKLGVKIVSAAGSSAGYGISSTSGVGNGTGGSQRTELHMWIQNGATPGNVQLQWAELSPPGLSITVRKGSFLVADRIA